MTKIGVLVSKGFGAGWSSWGCPEQCLDKELVKAFEDDVPYPKKESIAKKNWPGCFMGGLSSCEVEYVDEGTLFRIDEHDGSETLITLDGEDYMIAK